MTRTENHHMLKYWNMNNLYRLVMLQKLSVGGFQWVEETSQFNEDFINEDSDERYFLEVEVQYVEELHELDNHILFLPERTKIKNV